MTNTLPLFQRLGPGLLYAGAAVGVSHLVQSTSAGAQYGLLLIWAVVLANLLKFPFFEFGPRYAAATGKTLLDGYNQLGKWAIVIMFIMTLGTMFIVQAAVTIVTAGLAEQITGAGLSSWQWSGILLLICLGILGFGRYSFLDRLMKIIIVTLTITTIIALVASFFNNIPKSVEFQKVFSLTNTSDLLFLVALVGWMPAPIDIAIWHSIWTIAKSKESGIMPTLRNSLLDFRIGYWGTTFLAICFVALGAMVMYGSGKELSPKGAVFAGQVINMYTSGIGAWAYFIIAIAAFTTMFSTTLTCLDAFPRVMRQCTSLILDKPHLLQQPHKERNLYWFWIIVTCIGALILLGFFLDNMKGMITLATTVSFVLAPILALLNYMAVTSKEMPEADRPGKMLRAYSRVGLVLLFLFSFYYIYLLVFVILKLF